MSTVIVNGKSMDLLIEECIDYRFLKEDYNDKKYWILEGIFLQAGIVNGNGREYPINIMMNEVNRYSSKMILDNRAVGELGHPSGPAINPERVSHKILSLTNHDGQGKDYVGKARVSNSPFGKIVQNFLEEEIKFGVSSRAVASVSKIGNVSRVQDDFFLSTAADIVMDPSAPSAFVRGVMENKEYILADGLICESKIDQWKNEIRKASMIQLEEVKLSAYHDFLTELDSKFIF